jgi:hypothetical protein
LQRQDKEAIITARGKEAFLLTVIVFAGGFRMDYSTTYRLAQEIRDSEEYRTYHKLKEKSWRRKRRRLPFPKM